MADYISRDDAVIIADYAADEHPYDKDRTRPETYSDYNQGWSDACDYIRAKLDADKPADVEPVRPMGMMLYNKILDWQQCSVCGATINPTQDIYVSENYNLDAEIHFCPNCGAKMDLEDKKR